MSAIVFDVEECLLTADDFNLEIARMAVDMEFCGYSVICLSDSSDEEAVAARLQEFSVPFEKLYCRRSGDSEVPEEYRREKLALMVEDGFNPTLVFGSGSWAHATKDESLSLLTYRKV